ncbi:DUF3581 family protein [Kiritimatiellaeota bacterium B1221]|nr:DUF3581 family protein [Kiritimatiellaeota bacterium B1221]
MNFLDPYTSWSDGKVSFTRSQASRFAKQVADDFNPIHDVDAKRFCVPGDLLFAVLIRHLGLYPKMNFTFAGMVSDGVAIHFDETTPGEIVLLDDREKEYLRADFSGEPNREDAVISQVIRNYVRFSGHNFPHVLEPLMAEHHVMINIDRPLVIYESMSLSLDHANIPDTEIEHTGASMVVDGKRGNVSLTFRFLSGGEVVGTGEKKMVLSGLREYNADVMHQMVEKYDQRKRDQIDL